MDESSQKYGRIVKNHEESSKNHVRIVSRIWTNRLKNMDESSQKYGRIVINHKEYPKIMDESP